MFKRLLIGAALGGAVVYFVRSKLSRGYDEDAIDSSNWGEFGDRPPESPEEKQSPAQTLHNVSPEELSEASRIEMSMPAILKQWPALTDADVRSVERDRDRLAALIAEKTEQPKDDVRAKLDGIIAQETPRPSYPAQ